MYHQTKLSRRQRARKTRDPWAELIASWKAETEETTYLREPGKCMSPSPREGDGVAEHRDLLYPVLQSQLSQTH